MEDVPGWARKIVRDPERAPLGRRTRGLKDAPNLGRDEAILRACVGDRVVLMSARSAAGRSLRSAIRTRSPPG